VSSLGKFPDQYAAEIAAQPEALRRAASGLMDQRAELGRIRDAMNAAGPIVFTGMGASSHSCHPAVTALAAAGIPTLHVDSAELLYFRRAILGPTTDALLAGLPPGWRAAARVLVTAWQGAARSSSAAETWHSVLRPHLAVHRTLSPGLLAVLAVWHNHRVAPRGLDQGRSPLQVSGVLDAPTDWLVALGYPPGGPEAAPALLPTADRAEERAA